MYIVSMSKVLEHLPAYVIVILHSIPWHANVKLDSALSATLHDVIGETVRIIV